MNAALESLRETVQEAIEQQIDWPQAARLHTAGILESLERVSEGEFDAVGREMAAGFDQSIADLVTLRDGPVSLLMQHGHALENVDRLHETIRELESLKAEVLADWPWSEGLRLPVDRSMVDESRAAILRGEGEPVEELIRRLRGESGII